ncbi:MAG: exodeoxyribonuclease VII small subunit [Magnetococcales bacterium]|nr:exodeoxyribonuclease VII small subunit [Magnetococcales bacterium]
MAAPPVAQNRAVEQVLFYLYQLAAGGSGHVAQVSFEQALSRLEEVTERLERGDLPLEEGLALFEEGMSLSRQCQDRLDMAEKRITTLTTTLALDGMVAEEGQSA